MQNKLISKLTIAIFLVAIVTIFSVVSCKKSKEDDLMLHLPNEISIPTDVMAENFKTDVGKLFSGTGVILYHKSGQIAFSIRNPNEGFSKFFVIQTEKSYSNLIREVKQMQIMYLTDMIVLNDFDNQQSIIYHVQGQNYNNTRAVFDKAVSGSSKAQNVSAFGLVDVHGNWSNVNSIFLNYDKLSDALSDRNQTVGRNNEGGGSGSPVCISGGVGSTSCSVTCQSGNPTSCQTTCSSGYYACCVCSGVYGNSCECRKNPPGES